MYSSAAEFTDVSSLSSESEGVGLKKREKKERTLAWVHSLNPTLQKPLLFAALNIYIYLAQSIFQSN